MYAEYLTSNIWLVVRYLPYSLAVYFAIIALFANGYRAHASVLFCYMSLIIISFSEINTLLPVSIYKSEFLRQELSTARIGICATILLISMLSIDCKALKHALLLCLMISVNYMLIYHLKEKHSLLSSFVYKFYDELIIIIYLTQAFISRDGINRAHNRVLLLLRAIRGYNIRVTQISSRSNTTKESN